MTKLISTKSLKISITENRLHKILLWLGPTVILAISLWLRRRWLWVEPFEYDEGIWLMFGVLANAGYSPYTVTFVGIPPLALLTIQLGAKLFGTTLAVRYPMMLFSLVGIGSIFWSFQPSKKLSGYLVSLLAMVFLSFELSYFRGSGTIMSEIPAVAMAILSLALAQRYYFDRRLFWLILSGIAFTLSLALKLLMVFLPAVVGLLILLSVLTGSNKTWALTIRRLVVTGGVWLLGVALTLAVFIMIYSPEAMYQQMFVWRLALRQISLASMISPFENVMQVGNLLLEKYSLWLVGAIFGLVIGWRPCRIEVWVWLAWFILGLFPLSWQYPLRSRYVVMLLPPLIALSSITITYSVRELFYWLKKRGDGRLPEIAVVLLLGGVIVWSLAASVNSAFLPPTRHMFPDINLDAARYAWQNTTQDDCIVTDDQRFALAVDRLVPPTLSETSAGRLAAVLTTDEIVKKIEIHDCPLVVYGTWRFDQYLPDLRAKLRDLYFLEITYDENFVIYTSKKQVTRQPMISSEARLGQAIVLKGYDLSSSRWRSGQEVRLATYWTVLEPPAQAYKIFVQLCNSLNETVASFDYFPFAAPNDRYRLFPDFEYQYRVVPNIDSQTISAEDIAVYPAKGMVPTNAWPVGNTIREIKTIKLPNLTAGTYNLYLGMYDPDTLTRLKVQSQSEESDIFWLGQVEVTVDK